MHEVMCVMSIQDIVYGRAHVYCDASQNCLYIHTHIHTYIHTYRHTYIYIHTHIYIYIYIYILQDFALKRNDTINSKTHGILRITSLHHTDLKRNDAINSKAHGIKCHLPYYWCITSLHHIYVSLACIILYWKGAFSLLRITELTMAA